jgi:hypothetical protein
MARYYPKFYLFHLSHYVFDSNITFLSSYLDIFYLTVSRFSIKYHFVILSCLDYQWLFLQVAIRNIRRDAIKAYDKLQKVCSSHLSLVYVGYLSFVIKLVYWTCLCRKRSFLRIMWKIYQLIYKWGSCFLTSLPVVARRFLRICSYPLESFPVRCSGS